MGIPFLNGLLKKYCAKSISNVSLSTLNNKKIAIDISIYLYKYAAEKKIIENIHLMLTIFNKYNIVPVFIFDGKPPAEKKIILQKRKESKLAAELEYNRLKSQLDIITLSQSRQYSTDSQQNITNIATQMDKLKPQFIYITKEIINNVKELLRAYGATYYDSPEEADILCASLVKKNKTWACMSDDMDMFVYGCDIVIRDLNIYEHTATVYTLDGILQDLNVTQKEFRQICILSGTDYNGSLNNNNNNNNNNNVNLYKSFTLMKKFKRIGASDFNEWIIDNEQTDNVNKIINKDLLEKLYNMFDLEHENNVNKFKVFDNIKIINGKINEEQLHSIMVKA